MTEVMEQLDAARDDLFDDGDVLVGRAKDAKETEKQLWHKLLPHNAWRLIPFFDPISAPKDELELHQWYGIYCILVYTMYILVYSSMNWYIFRLISV